MIIDFLKPVFAIFVDFIETAVVALSIFVVIYVFLFQPHQVRGNSMLPNYVNGEYLLTNKLTYRFSPPKRGDVIVFRAPKNEDYDYIKRIIGLPGEKIIINNGVVFINDKVLDEKSYLDPNLKTSSGLFSGEGKLLEIPEDEYVVFGDNRNQSSDSRNWGFVPKKNIIGKAWLRYWPLSNFGFLDSHSYSD